MTRLALAGKCGPRGASGEMARPSSEDADSIPCEALVACARGADLFICDALCAGRDGAGRAERARELMHPTVPTGTGENAYTPGR